MGSYNLTITMVLVLINLVDCQIGFAELSKIGIIAEKNYKLKIKGQPTNQMMVLKLIPNMQNVTECAKASLDDYKKLLDRIVVPINDSLALMKSYINPRTTGVRFWGAVIGGVALGVATSAQITAGIALHNSIQNANAIKQMRESILTTNKAIEVLQDSSKRTVVAINALQDQINNNIVPSITTLGCEVAKNTLKLQLNQYFSEISLVFGPNLRDPASETISVQVLSRAFNGDFESALKNLGYNRGDFLDVLQSDSIRGRIIDVDLQDYYLVIQIEYPDMIEITGAVVQDFNKITFNENGEEWMALFPSNLLVRGNLISNIDVSSCIRTDNSYVCLHDTSAPVSQSLYNCAMGQLISCAKTRVVNSYAPRYSLSQGVVFANCATTPCLCVNNGQHIIQDRSVSNTMISKEICEEVQIDGIYITVGPRRLNRAYYAQDITTGTQVVVDKIDVGTQLSQITETIDKSKEYLDKSNEILNRINPNIVNTSASIYLIIISVVVLVWLIAITLYLIYSRINSDKNNNSSFVRYHDPSVSSLSSLIPVP